MSLEYIAHRGLSSLRPENTLSAFSAAVENLAKGIECDVQLSADGVPIILHDATLNRTTNGKGKVRASILSALKQLDAGSWFSPEFAGETIPTLQEVLELLQPTPLKLYAEIKETKFWSDADIEKLLKMIASLDWESRCIVASFDANFLQQVRQQNRAITLGYNVSNPQEYRQTIEKIILDNVQFLEGLEKQNEGNQDFHIQQYLNQVSATGNVYYNAVMLAEYHLLLKQPSLIATTRDLGIDIVVWTVDDPQDVAQLLDLGIHRIISNHVIRDE